MNAQRSKSSSPFEKNAGLVRRRNVEDVVRVVRRFMEGTLPKIMIAAKEIPIVVDKEILSGTPVFEGTRVPVSALLDNLEVGVSLGEFLENFPTVTREQAVQVLEYFKSALDEFEKAA